MGGLRYLVLLLLLAWPSGPLGAGTSELIVADHYTGLAIAGYDPVAYFVAASPVPGRSDYELRYDRGVFRFRNEGNRAAFAEHPTVYAPRFGGYDPIALARGVAVAGNPLEWQIIDDRLYLFYSPQAQAAFAANPRQAIAAAEEHWAEVSRGLIP
jgi:hypothetical protein